MIESKLDFTFEGTAIKFDETPFYTKFKSYHPSGKGVDFISMDSTACIFVEVKNCLGYEQENMWRSGSRNKKMIMKRIQDKLAQKLKWLNGNVRVVDSEAYRTNHFTVEHVTT